MGFMNPPPRLPSQDPELMKQRLAEQKRLEEEERRRQARLKEDERKRVSNLIGQRALMSAEAEGFEGYKRKQMGKSIRS